MLSEASQSDQRDLNSNSQLNVNDDFPLTASHLALFKKPTVFLDWNISSWTAFSRLTAATVENSYFLSAHQITLTFCIGVCLEGCSGSLFKPSKAYCMQLYKTRVRWAESKGTDGKSRSMLCGLVWIVLQHKCSSDIKRLKVPGWNALGWKFVRFCLFLFFFPETSGRRMAKSWEIYELVFAAL